jgi:hypothetical protein
MSFLDAFIGGAAQTGMGLIDQRMRDDAEVNKMRERGNIEQQLAIARQEALREINAKMGQQVSDMADTTNRQRIADRINSANSSEMSAEDAAAIAKNPEAMKAYGLSERSRAQEMDDLATAAGKYGAIDQAKMYRDQQNVEVRRDAEERNLKLGEERNRLTLEQMESKERLAKAESERKSKADEMKDAAFWGRTHALLAKRDNGSALSEGDRKTYTAAMQDASRSIATESAKLKTAYDPQEKKVINDRIETLIKDHDTFRQLLIGSRGGEKDRPSTKAPPSIASIKGAPPGSSIGSMVSGQGWEVKDSSGKVIGYAKD